MSVIPTVRLGSDREILLCSPSSLSIWAEQIDHLGSWPVARFWERRSLAWATFSVTSCSPRRCSWRGKCCVVIAVGRIQREGIRVKNSEFGRILAKGRDSGKGTRFWRTDRILERFGRSCCLGRALFGLRLLWGRTTGQHALQASTHYRPARTTPTAIPITLASRT